MHCSTGVEGVADSQKMADLVECRLSDPGGVGRGPVEVPSIKLDIDFINSFSIIRRPDS